MFNVTKALKKLDEIYDKSIIPSPVIKHIREIFLAGQDDEPETMFATACCELMKRVASIEERLARLERNARCCDNGFFGEEHDCQKKEPSKPTEEHNCKECGTTLVSGGAVGYYCPNDDCPCWDVFKPKKPMPSKEDEVTQYERERMRIMDENCKPEKTVTDVLSIGHLSDIGAFNQKGAKLKPVTEEKPQGFAVTWQCRKCAYVWDSAMLTPTCPNCQSGNVSPKDDKPSEFISCSCCGGRQVYIRGKHPKDDNRLVCPTCAVERLERIQTIADKDYGKAYQAKG